MSWFKKLFQMFNNEEEEYIEESTPQKKEGARDIDARIYYQYPKGQFRFPVIPDEEKAEQRSKRLEKNSRENVSAQRMTSSRRTEKRVRHETTTDTRTNQAERKKQISKKPFRPTQIPSPIYGYDRHPPKSEPIEFELDHFSNESIDDQESVEAVVYQQPAPEEWSSAALEKTEVQEPIAEQFETLEETEVQDPIAEQLESIEETEEQDSITVQLGKMEETVTEDTETKLLENELVQPEYEPPVAVQEEEYDVAPTEEVIIEDNIKEEGIKEENSKEENSPALIDPPLSAEPRRRSHIPFNVIMLKEDKRKLYEKIQAEQKLTNPNLEKAQAIEELKSPILEVSPAVEEINEEIVEEDPYYIFPSLDLLKPPVHQTVDTEWLQLQEEQLNDTLFNFNVRASVVNVTQGPSVTRFEVRPEPGVKVNKITNLADDIKLSLAAKDIRMEAPIPGTHMIGIEVPNETSRPVFISEILTSEEFSTSTSPLTAVLGLDISGKPIVTDLRKMPHGLIAGATGSGKSVCINSILISLLYKANPNEVKLLLIDPKMVELAPYNQIPHLVSPVITDVKAATAALKWAVEEMERRYELFAHAGVRDIKRFNEIADQEGNYSVKLPYIVIVIDELADLMMMSPADVEEAICRIAQKARACGIHLIIATQRPSVDVITGLIKANVPTRIAFSVSSQIDSRTIIDISGAERLLGRGDMLFLENGSSKPVRLQGTFVSDEEIESIVHHVRREQSPQYLFEQEELLKRTTVTEEEDELFYEACEFVIEQGGASTSSLQRKFKIGYNRAARLIDMMEEQGFISEAKGSKPRDVLITESELEAMQE
ncbi:DNA translocase FtsK [Robertmurraya andreesenii]|uniref:S-DNA-T family DNA segregation ATPase FtsK/SpoIIIE n=1 Tax=Anoxybacillus andreesenii TaxID=1325932 RepID=A0ABT9V6K0_9BACL|nr:DNA translocase FtsK [Robertmurraya andreesenii]MDQ0156569.1 S-DNA-T family DNA segregation ATPase FtsK/SpoIIIE [Robertmurraya andreesenii]